MGTNGSSEQHKIAVAMQIEVRIDGRLVALDKPFSADLGANAQILMAILTAACFRLGAVAGVMPDVVAHAAIEAMRAPNKQRVLAPSPDDVASVNRLKNKE